MNIKLNYLHLSNFKGAKDFKLIINGRNANVYGDNDRGKTTLEDAWNWLLFDKNSDNVSDTNFKIKPQDSLGQDINHLQTVVEAELSIDGKPLKLKKLREEKWVTRRGTTEPAMDGHTKLYWFNEVPVKAREYQSKVDELISEDIFKMITDPLYFNTKIDWKDRRNSLLEISGDATDEEVIASDASLSRLTGILKGRSIDDYKLVIADQLKNYKKERDNLPPRIDELTLSLPQEEPDYTAIETELKGHRDKLSSIEFLLTNATNKANKITEKYQELARLKGQLEETKARIKSEEGTGRQELLNKQGELLNGTFLLKQNIQSLESQIEGYARDIKHKESELETLRNGWNELNTKKAEIISRKFNKDEVVDTCPTCNQKFTVEDLALDIAKMEKQFHDNKNNELNITNGQLELNKETGLSLRGKVEQAKTDKTQAENELSDKKVSLIKLQEELEELSQELSKPMPEPDYRKYPEMTELSTKIDNLAYELDKPVEDKSSELLQQKSEIQTKIDDLNKVLNGKEEIEKKKSRIEELKTEEKRVSTLIAELEGHKFLLERFTVAKVNLLEDSINSQFKHVKFKLFEENVTNEGIKETCIALVNTNGAYVPFQDANSAGKINAGIDCINSLSKFYGVTVPLWVDNRESVTKLADTDSQVISLTVSEKDKELRVEVE